MPAERIRPLYLALDQGGHASRALAFDARGVAQARSLREVQVHHPQADWVEQDPDDLVVSLLDATRERNMLRSDSAYIEYIARTEFHMARPNETIFRYRSR